MMTKLEQMFESKISNYRSNKLELAARQALEALEEAYENGFLTGIAGLKTIDTITVMREALAEQADGEQWSPDDMAYRPSGLSMEQAEQEPVAERKAQVNELIKESARLIAFISDEGDRYLTAIDMLRNAYRLGLKDAAPTRTKDLTDEDVAKIKGFYAQASFETIVRAAIAADREKNR